MGIALGKEEEKIGEFEKYEVEMFLDTLKRAEEIKNDPDKMAAVRKLFPKYFKEEKKKLGSLKDLREVINQEDDEESEEESEDDDEAEK